MIRKLWKKAKIETSESATPWNSMNKLDGSLTISTPNNVPTSIGAEKDSDKLGRLSSLTFGGNNNTKLTVISTYRTCIPNENMGFSTVHV